MMMMMMVVVVTCGGGDDDDDDDDDDDGSCGGDDDDDKNAFCVCVLSEGLEQWFPNCRPRAPWGPWNIFVEPWNNLKT